LRSRYSDWLRAGRPGGRSSNPVGARFFSSPRRTAQGPTQPPTNGYRGLCCLHHQGLTSSIFRYSTLKMDAANSSQTLVHIYKTIRRPVPEDHNYNIPLYENFKSHCNSVLTAKCTMAATSFRRLE
jgi:hypothetical protein